MRCATCSTAQGCASFAALITASTIRSISMTVRIFGLGFLPLALALASTSTGVSSSTGAVWGDFSEGAPGPNGDTRRNGCVGTIKALQAAGGAAKYLLLPEAGQKGNSHMLMLDKNNLAIADLIIGWIGENVRGM
jgi:hypothetical protein